MGKETAKRKTESRGAAVGQKVVKKRNGPSTRDSKGVVGKRGGIVWDHLMGVILAQAARNDYG